MRKDIFPSVKEALPVVVLTALFLLLTAVCIGLRTEHLLMTGLFLILFFAGKTTRKLAVALLPFIIFGISYDWMRVYPNYEVNPIDVQGLYEAEKSLFGISMPTTALPGIGAMIRIETAESAMATVTPVRSLPAVQCTSTG